MASQLLLTASFLWLVCHAYRPETLPCRAHFQCLSGYCNPRRLCDLAKGIGDFCNENQDCTSFRCSEGICKLPLAPNDEPCVVDEDCWEGYCEGICRSWKGRGETCGRDDECDTGRCSGGVCTSTVSDGGACQRDSDCFAKRCVGSECRSRRPNGEFCPSDLDCLSLRCDENRCTEPALVGQACDEPSDCYSLFCHSNFFTCAASVDLAGPNPQGEPERPDEGITGSGYTPPPTIAPTTVPSTSPTITPTISPSDVPSMVPTTSPTEVDETDSDSMDGMDSGDNIFDNDDFDDDGLIDDSEDEVPSNETIIDMNMIGSMDDLNETISTDESMDSEDEDWASPCWGICSPFLTMMASLLYLCC